MPSPLSAYKAMIADGTLSPDPAQEKAIGLLDRLARQLAGYQPGRKPLFSKAKPAPKGLYLWGGVGVGKSLLMDLFFENAPVARARRVHFHAFMQETHRFLKDWRALTEDARKKHPARARKASIDDPIPHAAKAVAEAASLLCFDELQVTDITDAMILGRLFTELFKRGVVVVATSNRPPVDLYKDGINRELFIPFIGLLQEKLDIHQVVGAKDYRLDRLPGKKVYFHLLGKASDEGMNAAWRALTAGGMAQRADIKVGSRTIIIPCATRGVARGSFDHWCGDQFGPGDYLTIAGAYPTVFIDDVPQMGPAQRNEAKRFATFIDALYEARCTLVCSAETAPDMLYKAGDGSFEFERTASRLHEMQSEAYLQLSHQGMNPASLKS